MRRPRSAPQITVIQYYQYDMHTASNTTITAVCVGDLLPTAQSIVYIACKHFAVVMIRSNKHEKGVAIARSQTDVATWENVCPNHEQKNN